MYEKLKYRKKYARMLVIWGNMRGDSMKKILIADDADVNREIITAIFSEEFNIIEARDGGEAITIIDREREDLSLILLDLVMPVCDGLGVLTYMKRHNLVEKIPVIMITGKSNAESDAKAYEYDAADIIYKPFSARVVSKRVHNIIELYESRRNMEKKLEERTMELKYALKKLSIAHEDLIRNNDFLISALVSVLELRSLETGLHIQRVQIFTRIMLEMWIRSHEDCEISDQDIDIIVEAAALHDIGKIAISDDILCKPSKLTKDEYEIMKTHTIRGCEILEHFKQHESVFYKYCHDICRYHHERHDGQGYPDGLVGAEIPVWSQVVAIADVYDALVSPRVYKDAYDHDIAFSMISSGQCGVFSPDILDCFNQVRQDLINVTSTMQ